MKKLSLFDRSAMIEEQLDDFKRRIEDGDGEWGEI